MQLGQNLGQKQKVQPRYKNRDTRPTIVFKIKTYKDGSTIVYQLDTDGTVDHIDLKDLSLNEILERIEVYRQMVSHQKRVEVEYL